ncbi:MULTISPECIES: YlxQ family RNA-binding protein [Aneurinibacillus]|jgi:ribosomal protein L7Ae-like RNA K-turn-binding protein|uniref:Ribosomal protein L7Ae n=1 Tax=Aneurinibacillus thermoaerophilus TaxID=143495 RepID=A0A1G7WGE5_ANETH|nr:MULTISPECIES: YlxQ family RNA-binding protein [Aneurinibacillus]AMA72706.1 50S ribosomal protein L7ae [Aneurinibacillus sp. XH2]MED0674571.1 YlxQ family RNA-binding protein [Aneurinibacillus thermoaerophilus]MED0677940.1 YlxQ family RNA-binding protein [Aneurinibacillus thermoaerophilus]MED0736997.1 YlxQ family RNA-binding protein [Aneurinibacillus thermoaerophilus]MED0756838.1 YlxQ family RNA-binding protein [Aneurinibacillus thermoaerophilus]
MNKVEQMLGLAQRARKIITGEEFVIKAIRQGQVRLVILAEDASPNTRKKVMDKCSSYHVPCETYGDRCTLGAALGKEQRVVIGVTDVGFAARLTQLIHQ